MDTASNVDERGFWTFLLDDLFDDELDGNLSIGIGASWAMEFECAQRHVSSLFELERAAKALW